MTRNRVLVRNPAPRLWSPGRRGWTIESTPETPTGEGAPDIPADDDASSAGEGAGAIPAGDPGVSALMAGQLRLGLTVCACVAAVLYGLPVLLTVARAPEPLYWVILAVGVYPVWLALAWWYVHRSELREK